MENQNEPIETVRWEIGEGYFFRAAQNKKFLLSVAVIFFLSQILAIWIYSGAFFLLALSALVVRFSLSYNKLKSTDPSPVETYKIDNFGIKINKLKEGISESYPWSELKSYYYIDGAVKIVEGFYNLLGRRIAIVNRENRTITLRLEKDREAEILGEIKKRLTRYDTYNGRAKIR